MTLGDFFNKTLFKKKIGIKILNFIINNQDFD